jgi:MoxR-like ATPase
MKTQEKIANAVEKITEKLVEREDHVRGVMLAILSKTNVLLLGSPGTAKSMLAILYQKAIKDAKMFERLLTKFTSPDEVVGPFSLKALDNDEYVRLLDGYIGDANIAFLDEIFKSSSALLNSLLTIINERKITNGKETVKIPLLTVIGASNEIPELEDGLSAFLDRFLLKYDVRPIVEGMNRIKMLKNDDMDLEPLLSFADIKKAQEEVEQIVISDDAFEMYNNLILGLKKAGLGSSDRTYKLAINLLKAEAYLNGNSEVTKGDFEILRHAFWSDPEQQRKLYSIILKDVNPAKEEIVQLYNSAKELLDDIENETDPTKKNKASLEALNNLKTIQQKIQKIIALHKDSMSKNQLEDLNKYSKNVEKLFELLFAGMNITVSR